MSEPLTTAATKLAWRPTTAPTASSRTDDVFFVDVNVGWAVNSNGNIIHTTDGGDTWSVQSHQPVYFRCLGFANALKGWAGTLTAPKLLFETSDGGVTWNQTKNLPKSGPRKVCGLSVVNESVAYASGTNDPEDKPAMMKTIDGGLTWQGWDMKPWADMLIDNHFVSPDRGWVVGGKSSAAVAQRDNVQAVVLFTEDGGKTWTNQLADITNELPLGEWGWKIHFLSDNVGFISLENFKAGAILKTIDGGKHWQRLPVNDEQKNSNLEGVGFIDEKNGWVGGWGDDKFFSKASSKTTDGGLTWHDANEIGRAINRFRFFGNPVTVGYASGQTVYKYTQVEPATAAHALVSKGKFLHDCEPMRTKETVNFEFTVPDSSEQLTVQIWDRFGKEVRTLLDEKKPKAGERALFWDRTDDKKNQLSPGAYIWRITVDDHSESRITVIT